MDRRPVEAHGDDVGRSQRGDARQHLLSGRPITARCLHPEFELCVVHKGAAVDANPHSFRGLFQRHDGENVSVLSLLVRQALRKAIDQTLWEVNPNP